MVTYKLDGFKLKNYVSFGIIGATN